MGTADLLNVHIRLFQQQSMTPMSLPLLSPSPVDIVTPNLTYFDTPASSNTDLSWSNSNPDLSCITMCQNDFNSWLSPISDFTGDFAETDGSMSQSSLPLVAPLPLRNSTDTVSDAWPDLTDSSVQVSKYDHYNDNDNDGDGLPRAVYEFFTNQETQQHNVAERSPLMAFLMNDLTAIMDIPLLDTPVDQHRPLKNHTYTDRCSLQSFNVAAEKYKCNYCHCDYTRNQDRDRHINAAHTKEKIYICCQAHCSGAFSRSDVLKRHLRNIHRISDPCQ